MTLYRNLMLKYLGFNKTTSSRHVTTYVQGQMDNKIREYFYYIDHNGMVGSFCKSTCPVSD